MKTQSQLLTADAVVKAWLTQTDEQYEKHPPEVIRSSTQMTDAMLRLLAGGQPVSAQQVADELNVPLDAIESAFEQMRKGGYEFDDEGNLVGAALTLNPTRHQFTFDGKTLYAWCALDTLFLPGLLGVTAEVTSSCPQTGETMSLTITHSGIPSFSPPEIVLSIAVPGVSCARGDKRSTGPDSESCTQMNFFSSRRAAEAWIQNYPGVAILTVEEAWRLAYKNWIVRREKLFN